MTCICFCHGDYGQAADVCEHCGNVVVIRAEDYDRLRQALDEPARILPRLRRLLKAKL